MAFAVAARNRSIADMNITPLVDVMLVLLVIFMIAMPPRTLPIQENLPQPRVDTRPETVPPITLRIDADNRLRWNGSELPMKSLADTMRIEAARYPGVEQQPILQIDTDRNADYGTLAQVLATAKDAGLERIGFVDDGSK